VCYQPEHTNRNQSINQSADFSGGPSGATTARTTSWPMSGYNCLNMYITTSAERVTRSQWFNVNHTNELRQMSFKSNCILTQKSIHKSVLSLPILGSRYDAACMCCWAPAPRTDYRSISAARAGAQQQTRRTPPLLLSIDGTDRQTDGRTDTRPVHRPCST